MNKKELEIKENLKKLAKKLQTNSIIELTFHNAGRKKESLLLTNTKDTDGNILKYYDSLQHDNIQVELHSYDNINNCIHYKTQVLNEHFKTNIKYITMLLQK